MTERTAQDYAIEHGEYLATSAEQFMALFGELHPPSHDDRSDAWGGLKSAIYEFRKRAARVKSDAPAEKEHSRPAGPVSQPATILEIETCEVPGCEVIMRRPSANTKDWTWTGKPRCTGEGFPAGCISHY